MNSSSNIKIIAEGQHWFAVAKPAGISVHNDDGDDVISAFSEHENLHLLNRIDKEVSGIVLLATDKQVASDIQTQFAQRLVKKHYKAIALQTEPLKFDVPADGEWKNPLSKSTENRKNPAGWKGRRVPCQTVWQLDEVKNDQLYLTLMPVTGRKHQLRRHAAIAGWPLLGDRRYGEESEQNCFDNRIALHAYQIEFEDPSTHQTIAVTCPAPWQSE